MSQPQACYWNYPTVMVVLVGFRYGDRISSKSRWRHHGDVRDLLGRTLPTILGTGNGLSALTPKTFALLGRHPQPAPPDQLPVAPDANSRGTTGAFLEYRRAVSATRVWLRIVR